MFPILYGELGSRDTKTPNCKHGSVETKSSLYTATQYKSKKNKRSEEYKPGCNALKTCVTIKA